MIESNDGNNTVECREMTLAELNAMTICDREYFYTPVDEDTYHMCEMCGSWYDKVDKCKSYVSKLERRGFCSPECVSEAEEEIWVSEQEFRSGYLDDWDYMKTDKEINNLSFEWQTDYEPWEEGLPLEAYSRYGFCAGYKQAQQDILSEMDTFTKLSVGAFCDLQRAYDSATSNEECAEILRLFTKDHNSFVKKYGRCDV